MLGTRSAQRGLFEADHLYLKFVGEDTFYGFLARLRGKLFRDEDFADLYCPDNGRPSVPPSLLANALLLQAHDVVRDQEAKDRSDYDLRWKVALGTEVTERPFAKSTLQEFRSQLVLKGRMRAAFERSLAFALESGYLKKRKLRAVLDTTNILGRGAVKDTYNLLADGIGQLLRALVKVEAAEVAEWAQEHGLERYLAPSIKGGAEVDWDDEQSRNQFLQGIVADADRLLGMADEAMDERPEEDDNIQQAAGLLKRLIGQDVERSDKETTLKEGVARNRVVSVHDPDMRHGRKSSSKRFDGHKAAIAVDAESQLITAVEVLAGNAPDKEKALELTEASEENTGLEVEETIGDCAFGDGGTRQEFADANRKLVAKVAAYRHGDQISKGAFRIDLDEMTCTCPADQTTSTLVGRGYREDHAGKKHRCQAFVFDAADCSVCPLRLDCVKAKGSKGRTISLHPQERLLQEARALQDSEAGEEYRQMRQVVEHRLARLVQLGIRQARYFGRKKTLFQLLMAATVANLTLVANKTGQMASRRGQASPFFVFFKWAGKHLLSPAIGYLSHLRPDLTPAHREKLGFRPGF